MTKLLKDVIPTGHTINDFIIENPVVATKDGVFDGTNIADLGFFGTNGVFSNKYYHACVCKSQINNKYYAYFEWGRTNESKCQFQFFVFDNQQDAHAEYARKLHSKNDKRGEWIDTTLGRTLRPKLGKDCYLIRSQKTRSVGLPCARKVVGKTIVVDKPNLEMGTEIDQSTLSLFKDLLYGTTAYAQSIVEEGNVPDESAIQEARIICNEATKITNKLKKEDWKDSQELRFLTNHLYSRIPKYVAKRSEILLIPEVVNKWYADLDAFESVSNQKQDVQKFCPSSLNLRKIKYVPSHSEKGGWIYNWFPTASRNQHAYIQEKFNIKNLWFIERANDVQKITKYQEEILQTGVISKQHWSDVLFQPQREDTFDKDLYEKTNTALLFHGTRSVNVKSLLEKSFLLPKDLNKTQITGALFGSYAYFADDYKKSIGYTSYKGSYWGKGSGGINGRGSFMFLCDVVLGNMRLVRYGDTDGVDGKKYHSVFAKASYSGVQNNEFIIPFTEALRIRYLVEF